MLTPEQQKDIREFIVMTLGNYDALIRQKSGNIQTRGTIQVGELPQGINGSQITQNASQNAAQMVLSNWDGTPGDNITGVSVTQTPSGTAIMGLHSNIYFWIELATDYLVFTVDVQGIHLGTGMNFYTADGSAGLTTTQQFKDGAGATKTMTIKQGAITAIA